MRFKKLCKTQDFILKNQMAFVNWAPIHRIERTCLNSYACHIKIQNFPKGNMKTIELQSKIISLKFWSFPKVYIFTVMHFTDLRYRTILKLF